MKLVRITAGSILALLMAGAATANHATLVDCSGTTPGAFTSISAALATLSAEGPHLVLVRGTCQEAVGITGRRRLTITGEDGAMIDAVFQPPRPTVAISDSSGIVLDNITVRGDGIRIDSSTVALQNVTSEQSLHPGLVVAGPSFVRITGGQFHDNAGPGLRIEPGATVQMSAVRSRGNAAGVSATGATLLVDGDVTFEENRGAGLSASGGSVRFGTFRGPNMIRANNVGMQLTDGASAILNGLNVVKGHRAYGVEASLGASVRFNVITGPDGASSAALIEENGSVGINLAGSASAHFNGPHRIRNNAHATGTGGIRIGSTSRAQFGGGAEISGNSGPGVIAEWNAAVFLGDTAVINNTEEGVRVLRNSVTMLGGLVSGNGGASVTCDTTGLVVLQTNAITGVRCSRVERENGPPRPGAIK